MKTLEEVLALLVAQEYKGSEPHMYPRKDQEHIIENVEIIDIEEDGFGRRIAKVKTGNAELDKLYHTLRGDKAVIKSLKAGDTAQFEVLVATRAYGKTKVGDIKPYVFV